MYRRANLELDVIPASDANSDTGADADTGEGETIVPVYQHEDNKDVQKVEVDVSTEQSPWVGASKPGSYACGLRAWVDTPNYVHNDNSGLSGLEVQFCSAVDWNVQEKKIVYRGPVEDHIKDQGWALCPSNTFIVQILPIVGLNKSKLGTLTKTSTGLKLSRSSAPTAMVSHLTLLKVMVS